ncbi:MAG: iron-containing alcohol dehydrogenase [Succinivibrio sp.]
MNSSDIVSHTELLYGANQENDVGRQIKYLGGTNVLMVYPKLNGDVSNLIDKIKRSLKVAGLDYEELSHSDKYHPRVETIFEGIKICKNESVDFILAIGGAPEFVLSKLISASSLYEDNFYNIFKEGYEIDSVIPLGIISTSICAGDALSTFVSVSHKLEDGSITFYNCNSPKLAPRFLIFSAELCQYSSSSLSNSVVMLISSLMHRYFGLNKAQYLSESFTESSIKTVLQMYTRLKEQHDDLESINNLIWASVSSYTDPIFSVDNNVSIDILSRALVCVYDCEQEKAESILLPAWLSFIQNRHSSKIAKLGHNIFNIDIDYTDVSKTSKKTVDRIRSMFCDFGMPVKLREIGGNAADIEKIMFKAGFPEIESIGVYEKIDRTGCEVILSLGL